MRKLALLYYFVKDLSYTDKLVSVGESFNPVISTQGFNVSDWPGLTTDSLFIVDYGHPEGPKFLARLDPYDSEGNLRQAIIYALAGKFDKIGEERSKTVYRSGDPEVNGLWEGDSLDLPFPQIGAGDIWEAFKNLFAFSWVPWWAWAGIAAVASVKSANAKRPMCQAVFGVATAFAGYKAFKKFNQK